MDKSILCLAIAVCSLMGTSQAQCPPPFQLSQTPHGESVLDRWKRTKADWDRAEEIAGDARSAYTRQAFRAYMAAEDALKKAQCGQLCIAAKP